MIILIDNREQNPWDFTQYGFQQEFSTVKTGDYTIKGMEHIISVERKASTMELAMNFGKKWKTFSKELIRMDKIKNRYIICEFPMSYIYTFPNNSGIPKREWNSLKIKSNFLAKRIEEIVSEFNISILFSASKIDAERKFIDIINDL
jgi:hypothetical protein